ncbi:MAG: hypothetical protein KF830_05685 [Planctomycetes bacterium]|nr:hypothetical protein [Planctomycetota bacterium]
MTSPTASLLDRLLTRADLDRLGIPDEQVEAWRNAQALQVIRSLPAGDAADHVLAVPSAALRAELGPHLEALGKADACLSPAEIATMLQDAHDRGLAAEAVEFVAAATAELQPPASTTKPSTPVQDAVGSQRELAARGGSAAETTSDVEWFDIDELEAAMGDLSSAIEEVAPTAAAPDAAGSVEAAAPAADVKEDLYALAEIVDGHSAQLAQLAELPAVLESLAQDVQRLCAALQSRDGEAAIRGGPRGLVDRRHVAGALGFGLLGWSAMLWFGTGSLTLAVAAGLAGACIVALARRKTA